MKPETAQKIKEAAEVCDLEVGICENYSGRGMFGRRTTGVTGDKSDILRATAYAAFVIGRDGDDVDPFISDINFAWDSYGHDSIAY